MVRFPQQGSEDQVIRVEGNKVVVERVIASIEAFVGQKEGQTTDSINVPQEKHRLLIGRGGDSKRALESKFGVKIDVPRQGSGDTIVKITGQPSDNIKCKEHINSLIKEQVGERISIPRRLHHNVADNGQLVRRLKSDHKVSVDHAGQKPPEKPANASGEARGNGTNLPLITDDQSSPSLFSWHVHNSDDASTESGEIPWILRGNPEEVAKARAKIEAALAQAQEQSHRGFLILPDPSTYRLVVGPGGSQINSIRKQTNTKITVPREQAKGEAIEILGGKNGVEEAKDIILELISEGSNGRSSRR
jgi:polyribonucleotide nucleotidyltransferase